ncbi:Deuterolysin metalloprotease family-domain-containing protein [Aspergillus sergii]|uniref:Neutral protease 2 n=1 Tax=Aspergillus sergii TaxID=1034303 RepID=A0A5N6XA47_9EURO|nr:Deuterolysin metalloprotease family-domain-containing protein [Aspergillus sergii]
MVLLSRIFISALIATWGSVSAHPWRVATQPNADTGIVSVELVSLGNTTVMAKVTNTANRDLRVVKTGSIIDDRPTRKVNVYRDGALMDFLGVDVSYVTFHLTPLGFLPLRAGETIEIVLDVAELYNLSSGGQFTVVAESALEYTGSNTTDVFFWASYMSNTLSIDIPKSEEKSLLQKRAKLGDCSGDEAHKMKDSMARAAKIASAGAESAKNPSDLFRTFFKTDDKAALQQVSSHLEAIANEAQAGASGRFTQYCTASGSCDDGMAAYTSYDGDGKAPTNVRVYSCPTFWTLSMVSNTCWNSDQATIALHEYAHGVGVNPANGERETYGYAAITQLSSEVALRNPDSYAFFAQGAFLKCDANGKSKNPNAGKEDPSLGDPPGRGPSPVGSSGKGSPPAVGIQPVENMDGGSSYPSTPPNEGAVQTSAGSLNETDLGGRKDSSPQHPSIQRPADLFNGSSFADNDHVSNSDTGSPTQSMSPKHPVTITIPSDEVYDAGNAVSSSLDLPALHDIYSNDVGGQEKGDDRSIGTSLSPAEVYQLSMD